MSEKAMTDGSVEEASKWLCKGGPCLEANDRCKVLSEDSCPCVLSGNLLKRQGEKIDNLTAQLEQLSNALHSIAYGEEDDICPQQIAFSALHRTGSTKNSDEDWRRPGSNPPPPKGKRPPAPPNPPRLRTDTHWPEPPRNPPPPPFRPTAWISVEDRTPNWFSRNLICTDAGYVHIATFDDSQQRWYSPDDIQRNVTHWMPLPDLPDKDRSES